MKDWKELCKCGHHKTTHYESKSTCLGMHCDCWRFQDVSEDEAPKTPRVAELVKAFVYHDPDCRCPDCNVHDPDCTCADCTIPF